MLAQGTIAIHVTPRAAHDVVVGVRASAEGKPEVCVRVTAPPEGGKANVAVCKLVAKQLGTPKSSVSVKRGDTSRHKLLEVDVSQDALDAWLAGLPQVQ